MSRLVSCLFVFLFVSISVSCVPSFAAEWHEYKSTHFIIHHHPDISAKYIKEFARKCERYYDTITDRLGFNRFDFWLWEDRAKIFIYKSKEDYLASASRPGWSGAAVHVKKKHINTFCFHENFFDVMLPHELAHIILREFIGVNTPAPLWFDEGVASFNEKDSRKRFLTLAKKILKEGQFIPIPQLERMRHKDIKSPPVFYSTAASLVIYLLDEYNKSRFVEFCRELRDGTRFYEAMRKVYGIANAEQLEEKFLKFLGR